MLPYLAVLVAVAVWPYLTKHLIREDIPFVRVTPATECLFFSYTSVFNVIAL